MNFRLDLGPLRVAYEAASADTPVFVLLGWPVEHSLSPRMQTAAFRAAGVQGVYVAGAVQPASLSDVIDGLRARAATGPVGGANLTVPLKRAVMASLDAMSPLAALTGAVNTVVVERQPAVRAVRLVGHNTDVDGLVAALAEHGVRLEGARLLVTGSGGMARAAVAAALQSGVRSVAVCAREPERARDLLDELVGQWRGRLPALETGSLSAAGDWLAHADVLVQATSLGMLPGDGMALALDAARPGLFVFDAVYRHGPTPLLGAAQARGLRTGDGRSLLVHQGAAAFTLWTGRAAPLAAMRHVIGL